MRETPEMSGMLNFLEKLRTEEQTQSAFPSEHSQVPLSEGITTGEIIRTTGGLIVLDQDEAEYHAHPAVGRSDILQIAHCPAKWKAFRSAQEQRNREARGEHSLGEEENE